MAVRRGDAPVTYDCWSDGSADGVEQFPGLGPDLSKSLKSAVFLEGSYKRRLAGTTEDEFFDRLRTGVPDVAERAWAIATG